MAQLIVVALAALATSILSALAGLGGGVILLAVLAQWFAPTTAIPIQGGIQLVSNGSRSWMLRSDINWSAVGQSSLLLLPASLVGVMVASSLPENAIRLVMGCFVLVVANRPGLLKRRRNSLPPGSLVGVGALAGFLNTTVGATGPVTSPFFVAATAGHRAFVATAGSAQVLGHLSKLASYGWAGFGFADHLGVMAVGAAGVALGSLIGTRLMGRVSERQLSGLFRLVLTVLGLRLILQVLLPGVF